MRNSLRHSLIGVGVLALVGGGVGCSTPPPAPPTPAPEYVSPWGQVIDEVTPSLVFLKLDYNNATSFCSGSIITSDGYIATAAHCVNDDPNSVTAVLNDGREFEAKIIAFEADSSDVPDEGDSALLKINATDLPALTIYTGVVEPGLDIVSIGWPGTVNDVALPLLFGEGGEPSYHPGIIGSVQESIHPPFPIIYEVTSGMQHGMSGGPTVTLEGELVGINSFGSVWQEDESVFIYPATFVAAYLEAVYL